MFSTLSEQSINLAEKAIQSDKLILEDSNIQPSISYQYYNTAEEAWKLITGENVPINSYILFASNSYGYISYGFYKSNNNNIYIIEAYLNNISKVYVASKKIDCLTNLI